MSTRVARARTGTRSLQESDPAKAGGGRAGAGGVRGSSGRRCRNGRWMETVGSKSSVRGGACAPLQPSWILIVSWHGLHAPVCSTCVAANGPLVAPHSLQVSLQCRQRLYSARLAGSQSSWAWPGAPVLASLHPHHPLPPLITEGRRGVERAGFYEGSETMCGDDHETRGERED